MTIRYKQTDIGEIPDDWEIDSLRNAFPRLDTGVSVNSDDNAISNYYILKTSAVRNGFINVKEVKPVVTSDFIRLKCYLKQGTILISRMNTPEMVGECGYSTVNTHNIFLPDRLWQIEPSKTNDYNFIWLNYLLNTTYYKKQLRLIATGTSNSMKNIAKEKLLDISVPKPPIQEQERIAEVLSDVDTLIVSLEKLIVKKKAIKQGTMQELLTGKTRLPGFDGEWKERKLGDFVECIRGVSYDGNRDVFESENSQTIRLLRSNNIQDSKFIKTDVQYVNIDRVSELQRLNNDDIMICMANGSRALVGKSCFFSNIPNDKYTFGAFTSCLRKKNKDTNMKYIFYIINSYNYWKYISILLSGSSINNLKPSDILDMYFNFPSNEEQNAILALISSLDDELKSLEQKLAKTRQLKQGMMQQLLTGKIRLM